MPRYIPVKDCAKLVRATLKESFPGIKFSVRSESYAGGAAVRVSWTDGPCDKQVEPLISIFKGSYFDGMIDYKGSCTHRLDGELVRFSSDYITTSRDYSEAMTRRAWDAVCRKFPDAAANAKLGNLKWGGFGLVEGGEYVPEGARDRDAYRYRCYDLLNDALHRRTCVAEAKKSATAARVTFFGDDGYGMGTVGTPDNPRTAQGYPRNEKGEPY
jgi:Large polyvalent protein associated domain 29